LCVRTFALGASGNAAKIKSALEVALALADRLQHPLTLVFAQSIACHALYFTRDLDACQASAEQLVHNAIKYDLPPYRAIGTFWLGATQSMRGDPTAGLRQMEPAFETTHGIGFFTSLPGMVMADTLACAGRERDALALIARLHGEMSDPETGMFVSELWRMRGELIARARGGDAAEAGRSLQTALRIARAQEATLLQSRAGISLARHYAERGCRDQAREALAGAGVESLADRTAPEIATAEALDAELR